MDIFAGLRKLLGIGGGVSGAGKQVARDAVRQVPQQQAQRMQEDDLPVNTARGQMPLSSVQQGQPWQNPVTGYSPTGATFELPGTSPINGAVNPVWQQQKGFTPYSPGEGPQTNFAEILKRFR